MDNDPRGYRFRKAACPGNDPEVARVYYLNLVDEQGLIVSTEHGIREPDRPMTSAEPR